MDKIFRLMAVERNYKTKNVVMVMSIISTKLCNEKTFPLVQFDWSKLQ